MRSVDVGSSWPGHSGILKKIVMNKLTQKSLKKIVRHKLGKN